MSVASCEDAATDAPAHRAPRRRAALRARFVPPLLTPCTQPEMRNTTPRACAAATWPSRVHIRRHASGAPDREYAQSRARSRARAHPLLGDSRIPTPRWGTRGNQVRSLAEQVACAAPRVGKPQPMRLPDARRGAGEPQEPVAKRPASRPARALLPRHLPELARFATAKCGWAVMRRPRDRVPAALRPPTRPKTSVCAPQRGWGASQGAHHCWLPFRQRVHRARAHKACGSGSFIERTKSEFLALARTELVLRILTLPRTTSRIARLSAVVLGFLNPSESLERRCPFHRTQVFFIILKGKAHTHQHEQA